MKAIITPSSMLNLDLPSGFIWGASTSSYQIEGATNQDGRGASVWDTFCKMKDRIANGQSGDEACDHYHRYGEDIRLLTELGIQAYRFSIAWPRVLPHGRGAPNEKGLDFYDRLIDGLLEVGIDPCICLYHWDLPQALADLGGWTNRDSRGWFADYAMLVARRYGDRVKRWATFNEQNVSTLCGFQWGWSPPLSTELSNYYKAVHHQNLAHGTGIDVLRSLVPNASLGVIHNCQPVFAQQYDIDHQPAVELMNTHWNQIFPDPQILGVYPESCISDIEPYIMAGDLSLICRPLDWFGLNYYGPLWAKIDPSCGLGFHFGAFPEGSRHSELNWSVDPEQFKQELLYIHHRYNLPIYVTENGCGSEKEQADDNGFVQDEHRLNYLQDHAVAMAEAVHEGADVRGYYVWSLLDNFEWNAGYQSRFGIVRVDFDTQRRTPKASARWYAELIEANRDEY